MPSEQVRIRPTNHVLRWIGIAFAVLLVLGLVTAMFGGVMWYGPKLVDRYLSPKPAQMLEDIVGNDVFVPPPPLGDSSSSIPSMQLTLGAEVQAAELEMSADTAMDESMPAEPAAINTYGYEWGSAGPAPQTAEEAAALLNVGVDFLTPQYGRAGDPTAVGWVVGDPSYSRQFTVPLLNGYCVDYPPSVTTISGSMVWNVSYSPVDWNRALMSGSGQVTSTKVTIWWTPCNMEDGVPAGSGDSLPKPPAHLPSNNGVVVAASNVRAEPGTQASVVATLQAGNQVVLVGRTNYGDWLEINSPVVGWIYSELVSTNMNISNLPIAWNESTPQPPATPVPPVANCVQPDASIASWTEIDDCRWSAATTKIPAGYVVPTGVRIDYDGGGFHAEKFGGETFSNDYVYAASWNGNPQ